MDTIKLLWNSIYLNKLFVKNMMENKCFGVNLAHIDILTLISQCNNNIVNKLKCLEKKCMCCTNYFLHWLKISSYTDHKLDVWWFQSNILSLIFTQNIGQIKYFDSATNWKLKISLITKKIRNQTFKIIIIIINILLLLYSINFFFFNFDCWSSHLVWCNFPGTLNVIIILLVYGNE